MKKNIGVCTAYDDFEKIKKIHEIGYDFVEFSFSSFKDAKESVIRECADLLRELNLPCVSMNGLIVGNFSLTGNNTNHEEAREHVESILEKVQPFGTKNFVMGSGAARRVPDDYSKEKAMEQLQRFFVDVLSPAAKKYDAIITIEELRKEETNIFNTCRDVVSFLKGINAPNIKLLVDYYHAMLGGDTLEELASYKGYINHVHIASPSNARIMPLPTDGDDYKSFFKALDEAGYDKANISLEGSWDDRFDELAPISLDYLRSLSE